nr:hypothetical protein [Streptomyces sp. FT05W]
MHEREAIQGGGTRSTDGNGTKSAWERADAIAGQGKFMCSLMRKGQAHPQYDGSPTELALAGHNAGWGRGDEYRGMPNENFAQGQTYHYVRVCALGDAGSGLHSSVAQLSAECCPGAVNHLPGYAGSARLTELCVRTFAAALKDLLPFLLAPDHAALIHRASTRL